MSAFALTVTSTCSFIFFVCVCWNIPRGKLKSHIIFPTFSDKNSWIQMIQKIDLALMWGGSGCREYVYLQIKLSVLKQYLPGLFRYSSAVKPWVQLSLYSVNLPSFRSDSISFLPPPNTPIHIPIRSAQLTTWCCCCWWQNSWKQMPLFALSLRPPLRRFGKNLKRARKSKGA